MLRSHHHLRGFIKLVLWDVYCVKGAYTHEHIAKTPEADQPPSGREAPKKKEKMPE